MPPKLPAATERGLRAKEISAAAKQTAVCADKITNKVSDKPRKVELLVPVMAKKA